MLTILAMTAAVVFRPEVELRSDVIRLGDVAELSQLPPRVRSQAADLPLAKVDPNGSEFRISTEYLASQVRARMPMLGPMLDLSAPNDVIVRHRIHYGQPQIVSTSDAGIKRGNEVTFQVDAGPFHVARQGVAITDAVAGQRLFVRTRDGQVVTVLFRKIQ